MGVPPGPRVGARACRPRDQAAPSLPYRGQHDGPMWLATGPRLPEVQAGGTLWPLRAPRAGRHGAGRPTGPEALGGGPPSASGTCSLPPGESRDKLRTLVNKIGARTPEGPQNASGSSRPDWGSGLAEGRTPDARGRARTLTGTRQPRPQMSTQPGDTAWPSLEFFLEVPGEDRHPQRGVDPSAAWSARPGARLEQGASPLCPRHPRDARTPPSASLHVHFRSPASGPHNRYALALPCRLPRTPAGFTHLPASPLPFTPS